MVWKRLFGRKETEPSAPPADGPRDGTPPPSAPGSSLLPVQSASCGPGGSRHVRVFVSSTFRDMGAERDELTSQTWPELRRFCRERQVEFVEVDLRWGISEEQSTRRETLKLCLDEVHACRPYFIGLLGERYGWVPEAEAFTSDLEEEQPWVIELRDRSVTELEILHGVLNDPEMATRAFFYFRDPAYAAGCGPDYLPETLEAAARQAALKELIRAVCEEKGIPLWEGYSEPSALAERVQADLQAAIDAEYPLESVLDPLDREAREHEAFAEFRRRVYIGRPEYNEALDHHALGQGGPLVIVGESGGGKSALLANWLLNWRKARPGDFVFQHYIGATPGSASHWGLLSRLLGEIKRWTGDTADLPASHDDMLRDLPLWLAKLRARAGREGVRAIVVLDALNQIEEVDGGRRLGWLPDAPFTGALQLVVSSLPGETLQAVERRGWPALRVEPLAEAERRRMSEDYLARFSKRLDARRLDRLAGAPPAANPLYLKTLLDELRVTGTHERLDERLGVYLSAGNIPELLDQIMARWEEAYGRDRPGLVGEVLSLLWAARRGLSEAELRALLRPAGLPQLPAALWAPLRAALDESLVDRGGVLGFAHEFLRAAVERRYAAGERHQRALRLRLADYFEEQPAGERTCDELPWLLGQAGERDRLRACLLDLDRFHEIQKRGWLEVLGYWRWLGELEGLGARYAAAFETWQRDVGAGIAPTRAALIANELGLFLGEAGHFGAARAFHERALAVWREVYGEHDAVVATGLNNLGHVLRNLGDLAGARAAFVHALAIDERALGRDHPAVGRDLSALGIVQYDLGDLAGARTAFKRALAISERALGPDHPLLATRINNLAMVLQDRGDLAGARAAFERALAIDERAFGPDHPEVATGASNLGLLLQAQGDRRGARAALERALAIDERAFGPDHPAVARDANNLGLLLKNLGDLAGARAAYERALEIWQYAHGEDHIMVASGLNNLGRVLEALGDLAGAHDALERALAILQRQLPSGHPHVRAARANLTSVEKRMARGR